MAMLNVVSLPKHLNEIRLLLYDKKLMFWHLMKLAWTLPFLMNLSV